MKIVQCWSGGKDSTCAGLLHLEKDDNVTFLCYIPMFDKDIPLISKESFLFLKNTANLLRSFGAEVVFVNGISYVDYCKKIISRGPRKGLMQAYPCFKRGCCGFNRDSKTFSIQAFLSSYNFDKLDIGICADEDRKKLSGKECSILLERGLTQEFTFNFCKARGLLAPSYKYSRRDGCVLCPHGRALERLRWFEDYKEFNAFERLFDLQTCLKNFYSSRGLVEIYPLRGKRYFIEDNYFFSPNGSNISIFGNVVN